MPEFYSESSDDSESEELKKDFVEENPTTEIKKQKKPDRNKNKEDCPILSNTTLSVLRLCGKYLQMCRLLKPIALDVIKCMCQLFDYYLYNICHFFTKGLVSKFFSLKKKYFEVMSLWIDHFLIYLFSARAKRIYAKL